MKLNQLEMLVLLAETGSVQAVSERMHRTQAAVSMALKGLEEDVGVPLFDRSGYRLTLSAQGWQFLRQAREVVKQHQRLHSLAAQLQTGAEPQLHITYDTPAHLQYCFLCCSRCRSNSLRQSCS